MLLGKPQDHFQDVDLEDDNIIMDHREIGYQSLNWFRAMSNGGLL